MWEHRVSCSSVSDSKDIPAPSSEQRVHPDNYTPPRPADHPPDKPWPVPWREYPDDHPARSKDWTPTEPFNEDWAREDFGDAFVDALKEGQERFRGDWWLLAMLLRWAELVEQERCAVSHTAHFRLWNAGYLEAVGSGVRQHLEHADLSGVYLEHANFSNARLEHASLTGALLKHADFTYARLNYASLYVAHLEHANLYGAHLEQAFLVDAHLEYARGSSARIERANLFRAHLEHADLRYARLKHTNLRRAHLEHADLFHVSLDHAEVRGATGIFFNSNPVDRMLIEGIAPDPWSRLRREYTGPRFFFHLLLLIAFFLPLAAKVLHLSAVSELNAAAERIVTNAETRTQDQAWAQPLRQGLENFRDSHVKRPAVWVLLGSTEGGYFVGLSLLVLAYNGLRILLTSRIAMLRDAEERSKITPALEEYYGLCHPLSDRRVLLGLKREKATTREAVRWRDMVRIWGRRIRAWLDAKEWRRGDEKPWSWRKKRALELLSPLPVIGLYRVHQAARVLFWIAVAALLIHTYLWITSTWVWVPK